MEIINLILGEPLGYVMYWCYQLLASYGWAILLFTLLTKILLFPLSLVAQKNSIKMVKMQPLLEDIKSRNAGNGEAIIAEQKALYKREKYSTLAGVLPLLIQIPIILGLINVIYNPLEHLFHFDAATINLLVDQAVLVLNMPLADMGFSAQLFALEAVKLDPAAFSNLPDIQSQIESMSVFDMSFAGIDLSAVPTPGSNTVIIPILSGLSALALCLVQNKYNVLQVEQGFIGKWGMTVFLIVFSGYFAAVLPCGLGLYWTAGNLLSIPVLALCNVVYSPKKYIDYANRTLKPKLTREQKAQLRVTKKQQAARSKADEKRFYAADNVRELVFYSEANGFYKYFKGVIEFVLANSDIIIHYVTSDPNDKIFSANNPRIKSYFISPTALISFFMKLDTTMIVMTMPDLDKYHIKRSIVNENIEYAYIDHGMASIHMMLKEGALDHFDTIFCYGPNYVEELRQTEAAYGLPAKTLVKTGYALLDELIANVAKLDKAAGDKKQILIAPSWQYANILEQGIDQILADLLPGGYRVIVRPHPEFVKRFPDKMDAFLTKYQDQLSDDFIIETDFASNVTVYTSDLVVTDWSSIAQEFSYSTKRPSLFINTPMKVMNPNYQRIKAVPLDISLRDQIGKSVDMDKLDTVPEVVAELLRDPEAQREEIAAVVEHNIYDIGHGSEGAGNYIIGRIEYQRKLARYKQSAPDLPKAKPSAKVQRGGQVA